MSPTPPISVVHLASLLPHLLRWICKTDISQSRSWSNLNLSDVSWSKGAGVDVVGYCCMVWLRVEWESMGGGGLWESGRNGFISNHLTALFLSFRHSFSYNVCNIHTHNKTKLGPLLYDFFLDYLWTFVCDKKISPHNIWASIVSKLEKWIECKASKDLYERKQKCARVTSS